MLSKPRVKSMCNIVIIGQGAMGLLWYHKLASVSENVAFLSVGTNLDKSYFFTDINGIKSQGTLTTVNNNQLTNTDTILVCVKSYQVCNALNHVAKYLKAPTNIILAHNGMGTVSQLPKALINNHTVLTLLTTHGCLRTEFNSIKHTGLGISDIGVVAGKLSKDQQNTLTSQLNKALPSVKFHQNIMLMQWKKLAVNCVINPLTALNNVDNGPINDSMYQAIIVKILREVVQVAQAENIILDVKMLQQKIAQVAKSTAKNSSSMRCDLLAKRKTEIDYINGYIHRLGEKHNIATPENTLLWQQVKQVSGF